MDKGTPVRLHHIFPIPIGKFELGREFSKIELEFMLNQETRPNLGNLTSKNTHILGETELTNLKKFAEDSVNEFLTTVHAPGTDVSLRITQSWLNYTGPGQFHHKHEHQNSFLSGVLYIKSNKESDRIYFHKNNYQQIKLPSQSFNLYNSDSWWFEAIAGELIIFPSSLTHSVDPVGCNDIRVSLSFNTFPVGHLGNELNLTALEL